jgi:hypothetical protein
MKSLSFDQMAQINGGGWLGDLWDGICSAAAWVWDHIFVEVYNGVISVGLAFNF